MSTISHRRPAPEPSESRDDVLRQHIGLVYHVGHQIVRARRGKVDVEELVGAGTLGLMDALEHFDASRGLAFSTYAAARIRGAMLDELRRIDHVPRSVRRKARQLDVTTAMLIATLGREPVDGELAEELGIDLPTLWRWQSEREAASIVPLDRVTAGSDPRRFPVEASLPAAAAEIEDELTTSQESTVLRDALLALPEQERIVLSLYYFEELRLADIGRVLGVSESRVSQVRSKAIDRLRTRLRRLRPMVV